MLPRIWTIEISSGVVRRFVPGDAGAGTPAWSPDGEWVAYQLAPGGNFDLHIMNMQRTQQLNLTSYSTAAESLPDWSPDGRRLVFVSLYEGDPEIWTINVDGSDPVNLTAAVQNASPDSLVWLALLGVLAAILVVILFAPRNWQRPIKPAKKKQFA
jgi:TolB protein